MKIKGYGSGVECRRKASCSNPLNDLNPVQGVGDQTRFPGLRGNENASLKGCTLFPLMDWNAEGYALYLIFYAFASQIWIFGVWLSLLVYSVIVATVNNGEGCSFVLSEVK